MSNNKNIHLQLYGDYIILSHQYTGKHLKTFSTLKSDFRKTVIEYCKNNNLKVLNKDAFIWTINEHSI